MNILITGANGQLGKVLRDVSDEYGHKCFFTSRNEGSGVSALDAVDAAAVDGFMKMNSIDVIVNCAGYTDVAGAERDGENARLLNARLPEALAKAARENDAVLIHISTDYVFDGRKKIPYGESDETNPQSIYAKTKLEGDEAVMESGCKYLIFRTSWLYSCHGKNFFRTMEKKASANNEIRVVDDQTGTPTYAADLARAIFRIIQDGKLNCTGLYNFSDEGSCTWYEFAKAITSGLGYECDVKPCSTDDYPSNAVRPVYSVLDKSRFKETFGYEVPYWKDSLISCIEEFLEKQIPGQARNDV